MAVLTWKNGVQSDYLNPNNWLGGVAPGAGSTAVISSQGDQAPGQNLSGQFLLNGNQSVIDLTHVVEQLTTVYVQEPGPPPYIFEYTKDTPPPAQVPAGYTIADQTLDLLGAGSATGVYLQDTTLAASTVANVSGTSIWDATYNNSLDGTINVGSPITLNGTIVPTPSANAHGVINELDIDVRGNGSWTNSGTLTSYIPTTTNNGAITLAGNSELQINLVGNPFGAITSIPGYEIAVEPQRSEFVNNGTITIGAGSQMAVTSADNLYGFYNSFVDNGLLQVQGASGQTTDAVIQGRLTGGGTLSVNGGTQTDNTKTYVTLEASVSGMNFIVADASVVFDVNLNLNGYSTGGQFSGGGFVFADNAGILAISPDITVHSLVGIFNIPIDGFRAGDTIGFGVMPIGISVTSASFTTIWNQATQKLQVQETSVDFFGNKTVGIAASFTLEGNYSASSFHVASSWNGSVNSPIIVEVTTSNTLTGPQTYTLTPTPATIVGGPDDDRFIAAGGVLTAGYRIDGGGGTNTLVLSGPGTFDLQAPAELVNIQTLVAKEGQPASGSIASQAQTIDLRDGLNLTVDVGAATINPNNPNAPTITIYGANDSDLIKLAGGNDTVYLGSASEHVQAGSGNDLIVADTATAGALITGGAQTELEITNGGTASLNSNTSHVTVQLDQATHLTLSGMKFISAEGLVSGNTITARVTGQTLGGAAGGDTLIGASAYGDTFLGSSSGLNHDTIERFGGTDTLDLTDMNSGNAAILYAGTTKSGTLSVSDGTHQSSLTLIGNYTQSGFHIASDGHSGTSVTYT